jgi:hypothetical protein
MTHRTLTLVTLLATYLAMSSWALAGEPVVWRLIVTDVTPVSFSVVYISSESSTGSVRVFDKNMRELTGLKVLSESQLYPPAEDFGLIQVKVEGLKPNKTYYLQTVTASKSDGKVTVHPKDPVSVRTEKTAIPVNNSILAQKIYFKNEIPGDGSLLIVSLEGSSYPVSGWVGGYPNPPSPWALVDLNNLYSVNTHQNLEVRGGENIIVEVLGGVRGYARYVAKVPHPSKGAIIELTPPIVLGKP